jgi:hypothetical protein
VGGIGAARLSTAESERLINRVVGVTVRGRPRLQKTLPLRLRSGWAKRVREGEPRRLVPGFCEVAFLAALDAARATKA